MVYFVNGKLHFYSSCAVDAVCTLSSEAVSWGYLG